MTTLASLDCQLASVVTSRAGALSNCAVAVSLLTWPSAVNAAAPVTVSAVTGAVGGSGPVGDFDSHAKTNEASTAKAATCRRMSFLLVITR